MPRGLGHLGSWARRCCTPALPPRWRHHPSGPMSWCGGAHGKKSQQAHIIYIGKAGNTHKHGPTTGDNAPTPRAVLGRARGGGGAARRRHRSTCASRTHQQSPPPSPQQLHSSPAGGRVRAKLAQTAGSDCMGALGHGTCWLTGAPPQDRPECTPAVPAPQPRTLHHGAHTCSGACVGGHSRANIHEASHPQYPCTPPTRLGGCRAPSPPPCARLRCPHPNHAQYTSSHVRLAAESALAEAA